MKFTLNWLKKFLETDANIYEVAEVLNKIGHEVEEIKDLGKELQDFVVAEVLEAKKHPNADKLKLCKVFDGKENLQIVCGASNVNTGQKIILARIGVTIPINGLKIKKSKIRDVESFGMICASEELGLEKSEGIMVLENTAQPGQSLLELMPNLADPVIDVSVTANRSDCLGVYGIARELAAYGLGKLKNIEVKLEEKFNSPITVTIERENGCMKFSGIYIKNIKAAHSPIWLQNFLKSVGCKPISAVVDVTNYISLSFARPLHAYDADKITGNLIARNAKEDEIFISLERKEYKLSKGDLVIADNDKVESLAGIIGGDHSKFQHESKNVFLESAIFNPVQISKTSKKYSIDTDAKYRLERGVDSDFMITGVKLGAAMIVEFCGGEASKVECALNKNKENKIIEFDTNLIKQIGGVEIPENKILEILISLGFKFEKEAHLLKIKAPSWRHDISIPEDIVEEVLRIYGYDNIPSSSAKMQTNQLKRIFSEKQNVVNNLKTILTANGYDETITWSFMGSERAKQYNFNYDNLKIANPISKELDILRSSIIPNLVDAVEKNNNRSFVNLAFFECGPIYHSSKSGDQSLVIAGVRSGMNVEKSFYHNERQIDVFDIKSDITQILDAFGYNNIEVKYTQNNNISSFLHPLRSAQVIVRGKSVGIFGEVHPKILQILKIKNPVFCFELNLDLVEVINSKENNLNISDYQSLTRDFAFILDEKIPVGDVLSMIHKVDKILIQDVQLFDIYQNENIGKGKKSIAFSVTMQSTNKTLDNDEISKLSDQIISVVEKNFNAVLRDN